MADLGGVDADFGVAELGPTDNICVGGRILDGDGCGRNGDVVEVIGKDGSGRRQRRDRKSVV